MKLFKHGLDIITNFLEDVFVKDDTPIPKRTRRLLESASIEESNNLDYRDTLYLLQNQTVIGKECLEKGYAIVKFPSGRIFKVRELG